MRPSKSRQWRDLGDRVARLAEGVMACAARAHQLGATPPSHLLIAERDLWRWAETLRRAATTAAPGPAPSARQVAVILLVEVDDPDLDLDLVVRAVVTTAGPLGHIPRGHGALPTGWRIVRRSAHPDPAALVPGDPIPGIDQAWRCDG